jgi:hypothetical protein
MLKVKVIPHKLGNLKLAFVKCVKTHTNLGLKEAKDWCDSINSRPYSKTYFPLEIKTNVHDFVYELNSLTGYEFEVIDTIEERNYKLISLGLGDLSDKIDIVSKELARKLDIECKTRNQESLYGIYIEFFQDFLLDLEDEKLDKLVDLKLKKLNING